MVMLLFPFGLDSVYGFYNKPMNPTGSLSHFIKKQGLFQWV